MVVHSISVTATPPRPSSTLAFRMKQRKGAGLGSARRALSALGNNNAQINLRMAESLLTITQDKFMKKWNFDPVKETPMAPGRFQWTSASSGAKPDATTEHQEPFITANRDIGTCFTLPHKDIASRVPEPHGTTTTTVVEADSGVESDDSVIEDSQDTLVSKDASSALGKLSKCTDYLQPHKRPSSHLDDSLQLPASKKRLLLVN